MVLRNELVEDGSFVVDMFSLFLDLSLPPLLFSLHEAHLIPKSAEHVADPGLLPIGIAVLHLLPVLKLSKEISWPT